MKPFFSETISKAPVRLVASCEACGLYKHCKSPYMPVAGLGERNILIIGEAPGETEDKENLPFVGKAGLLLQESLSKLRIDLFRDCYITNSARCRPRENKLPSKAPEYCRPNLINTLKELKPEIIIPLGNHALRSLLTYIWRSHDLGTITKWAGFCIPSQKLNAWIIPNFHPSFIMRKSDEGDRESKVRRLFFDRYLERAVSLSGRPWDRVPDYRRRVRTVYDPRAAASLLDGFTQREKLVALDYENNMLKPDSEKAEIVCCSVYDGKECISYPWVDEAISATGRLLKSNTPKILANLKHEYRWTLKEFKHGITNIVSDTVLAAHTLDSRGGTTSVKFQAFVRLGLDSYDEEVKPYFKSGNSNLANRIREIPIDKLLLYCGLDSIVEYHLAKLQMEELGVEI